jgi:hypothetical protein
MEDTIVPDQSIAEIISAAGVETPRKNSAKKSI